MDYEGTVSKIGRPKIYRNPWGATRRFFVEFTDGQKAMFSATHCDKINRGDIVSIANATSDDDHKWMSVGESASITVLKSNTAPQGDEELTIETGYVTRLREDGGKRYYYCYSFKIVKHPEGFDPSKIRVIYIPFDAVWTEGDQPSPPAYSNITAVGGLVGDTWFVKEIQSEIPIQRVERVVLKINELNFHHFGADFLFKFGNEYFSGTIPTPFHSNAIYNTISENWGGFVEISGIWLKRGQMRKQDDEWVEDIYWQLWKGKENWEQGSVDAIKASIALHHRTEEFSQLMHELENGLPISYFQVAEKLRAAGYKFTADDVRNFMWHQDLEECYISFLSRISAEVYQATGKLDVFFFLVAGGATQNPVLVCEVPKDRFSTLIIPLIDAHWAEVAGKIQHYGRSNLLTDPEAMKDVGIFKTIPHSTDWEAEVLAAVMEAQQVGRGPSH
jgi:hypothetical protein